MTNATGGEEQNVPGGEEHNMTNVLVAKSRI